MKRFYWMTVLFSAALASAAQADSLVPLEPESFQLNQGAIVQISRPGQGETGKHPRVYLSDPSGELKSLDVPTGKILWRRTDGGYPLLARGNRLLALLPPSQGKPGCELAILDTRSGKTIKKLLNPTDLILEAPGEGLGDSYQIQCVTQDDRDVLVWTETWHPIPGGAYKGPDYVYPLGSSGQKQGLLVVDLAGGALLPPPGIFPRCPCGPKPILGDGIAPSLSKWTVSRPKPRWK